VRAVRGGVWSAISNRRSLISPIEMWPGKGRWPPTRSA
jgi:hypothetical protein